MADENANNDGELTSDNSTLKLQPAGKQESQPQPSAQITTHDDLKSEDDHHAMELDVGNDQVVVNQGDGHMFDPTQMPDQGESEAMDGVISGHENAATSVQDGNGVQEMEQDGNAADRENPDFRISEATFAARQSQWTQRQELFMNDPAFASGDDQTMSSTKVKNEIDGTSYEALNQAQQQPVSFRSQPSASLSAQPHQIQHFRQVMPQIPGIPTGPYPKGPGGNVALGLNRQTSIVPSNFQQSPGFQSAGVVQNQHDMHYQQRLSGGQQPSPAAYPVPTHGYTSYRQVNAPLNHGSLVQVPSAVPSHSSKHQQSQRIDIDMTDDQSDEDEPLASRVERSQPANSNSIVQKSAPATTNVKTQPAKYKKGESLAESTQVKSKDNPQTPTAEESTSSSHAPSPALNDSGPCNKDEMEEISWKLPTFEVSHIPAATKNDPDIAKVSIPGLVREEIILSPDHTEQELHLLLNVFMPVQKALYSPDLEPAHAVLNFHTIAVMVIEAFVQFEIGDEFGTGRGHWHDNHDRTEAEYKRLRDAKDADEDEIFFAVIDRWRAGMESNKEPSKMIRGCQEFCDVALDLIRYIKEHGLLRPEAKKKQRAERSDKGTKRAPKTVTQEDGQDGAKDKGKRKAKVSDEGEDKASKGSKKQTQTVKSVPVKKKTKVEKPKVTVKSKAKKSKEPQLVVIPRKK